MLLEGCTKRTPWDFFNHLNSKLLHKQKETRQLIQRASLQVQREREREATRGAELAAERRMRGRVKLRLGTAAEAAPDLGGRRGEGGWGTATDARGGRAAEVGDAGTAACGVDAASPLPSWS